MGDKKTLQSALIKGENGSEELVRVSLGEVEVCFKDPMGGLCSVVANKIGELPYQLLELYEDCSKNVNIKGKYARIQGIRGERDVKVDNLMVCKCNYSDN